MNYQKLDYSSHYNISLTTSEIAEREAEEKKIMEPKKNIFYIHLEIKWDMV